MTTDFACGPLTLDLELYPGPEPNRRAWSAADELLVQHLMAQPEPSGPVWVINDAYGALALAAATLWPEAPVVSWSDSFTSMRGAEANATRNAIAPGAIEWRPLTDPPDEPIDRVIMRLPRGLRRLEMELADLRPWLREGTEVVSGVMTKHLHTSTLDVLERTVGPTTTSLARKKARLAHSAVVAATADPIAPAPIVVGTPDGIAVTAQPGVFSEQRIDAGTALLIDHVKRFVADQHDAAVGSLVDLGCGSGAVGAELLTAWPEATGVFTDDSYMAVASAVDTCAASRIDPDRYVAMADDCGASIPADSVDVVCINPPFHDANARTNSVADRMFTHARSIVRRGGLVAVVGNRHLDYHRKLGRMFSSAEIVSRDPRYVVTIARK